MRKFEVLNIRIPLKKVKNILQKKNYYAMVANTWFDPFGPFILIAEVNVAVHNELRYL